MSVHPDNCMCSCDCDAWYACTHALTEECKDAQHKGLKAELVWLETDEARRKLGLYHSGVVETVKQHILVHEIGDKPYWAGGMLKSKREK